MAIITLEKTKIFLGISGSGKDELITALIPEVESLYLHIRNAPFDTDSNDDLEYPEGSELVAAQMVAFFMSDFSQRGGVLTSESIGSYAWSANQGDLIEGIPQSIYRRIKRYIGSRP